MQIVVRQSFYKDLKAVKNKSDRNSILDRVEALLKIDSLKDVQHLKKLKGSNTKYRIRIGNYRLGLIYENDKLILARVMNRNKFYQKFI